MLHGTGPTATAEKVLRRAEAPVPSAHQPERDGSSRGCIVAQLLPTALNHKSPKLTWSHPPTPNSSPPVPGRNVRRPQPRASAFRSSSISTADFSGERSGNALLSPLFTTGRFSGSQNATQRQSQQPLMLFLLLHKMFQYPQRAFIKKGRNTLNLECN